MPREPAAAPVCDTAATGRAGGGAGRAGAGPGARDGRAATRLRLWLVGAAVALVAVAAAALGIGVPATPDEPVAVDEPQYLLTALSLAQDGDLDIGNQLAERQWRRFTTVEPPVETVVQPDGSQVSPHDPLLPMLLAVPMGLGGWVAAKLAMSLLAGALAALALWVAVRRLGVSLPVAAVGVGIAAASAPLAVYGQQVYPELPAALACLAGVAALTGATDRRQLILLTAAVVALPWLSVKYAPVAAALAAVGLVRWWRAGARRQAAAMGAALVVAAGAYLLAHVVVWGGVTVYASGDHFQDIGELGVMGTDPSFGFRSWRIIDLLVDRTFGLVAWQPAWLLLVPALAALAAGMPERPGGVRAALVLPLVAGWLVATYPALTMHGHWWPGRQVVVVLPLALLVILGWLERSGTAIRTTAAALGLAGVFTYGGLLVDGYTGELAWVNHFADTDAPVHRLLNPLLADYGHTTSNFVWLGSLTAVAAAAYLLARRRAATAGDRPAPAALRSRTGRRTPARRR